MKEFTQTHYERYQNINHLHQNCDLTCKVCDSKNILTRPAKYEEACYIYNMINTIYGINYETLNSLSEKVSTFIAPDNKHYDEYRFLYNKLYNIYPAGLVVAKNNEDIINTIKFCNKNKIPFRIRSGGHAYYPASTAQYEIIIDLSELNKILYINEKKIIVQAGIKLGFFINECSKHNLIVPIGTCPTNGLGGFVAGGGCGFYQRNYGLAMDNLLGIKIINWKGEILNLWKKDHEDLFWACRGAGGGNFGIITEYIFKPIKLAKVIVFTIKFDFNEKNLIKLIDVWQEWGYNLPNYITTALTLHGPHVETDINGVMIPQIESFEEDIKKLKYLCKDILELKIHKEFDFKLMTVKEASQYIAKGGYARPLFQKIKSNLLTEKAPLDLIKIWVKNMKQVDPKDIFNRIEFLMFGGKIAEIPEKDTAFAYRNARFWAQYAAVWGDENEASKNIAWVNNLAHQVNRILPLKSARYVNFLDFDLPYDDAMQSYFGKHLPKLKEIKKKYDPHDIFHFEQSIKPDNEIKNI